MLLIKLYFHFLALTKIIYYKCLYGAKLQMNGLFTFRRGFTLIIEDKGEIKIGKNCFFNNYCTIASQLSISIGEGSLFGENVKVYDHNHCFKNILVPIKDQGYNYAPIVIGNHCWIASNVTILKGVTIGDNCVIGAGCIVYKDVPANCVLVNQQQQILKQFANL